MRSRTAVQPPSWTERPPRKPAGEKANATRQSNLIPAQSMRNRCTEASGLCRSRRTVDAKVKCSSTAQLRFPDALRDPLTPHQSFPSSALTPCSTPPSTWTSAHDHPRKHLHQLFLTSLTPHPSPFLRPIALSSYHPNPTHESSAPRRGFMSSTAAELPSHRGGRYRRREPSWVAERRRCGNPSEIGRPAGGRRRRGRGRRGCPDAGHAGSRPVRVFGPPCGRPSSSQADVRCPHVRCPHDWCGPGVRTDTPPVSVACVRAVRSAGCWNASVRWAASVGCSRFDVSPWGRERRGRLPGPDPRGRDGRGWR